MFCGFLLKEMDIRVLIVLLWFDKLEADGETGIAKETEDPWEAFFNAPLFNLGLHRWDTSVKQNRKWADAFSNSAFIPETGIFLKAA